VIQNTDSTGTFVIIFMEHAVVYKKRENKGKYASVNLRDFTPDLTGRINKNTANGT